MRTHGGRIAIRCAGAVLLISAWMGAAAQDPAWLSVNKKSDPDRYEGLLDQPNARREYDLLAFQAYTSAIPTELPADPPAMLRVEYCRPKSSSSTQPDSGPAYIEVRQKTGHVNYLMKASQTSSQPANSPWAKFTWPTKDVIRTYSVRPTNLGVVIHLGEDNEYAEDIEPAILTTATSKSEEVVDPGPIHYYELILRIQLHALDELQYTYQYKFPDKKDEKPKICHYEQVKSSCMNSKPPNQPPIDSGSLVTLRLDAPPNGQHGQALLHIEGSYKDSDGKLIANFRFPLESICR